MTGFTDTNLLSTRSVLFPTRKMSTSPPLCVFTSSIHFDVFKKDCVSAKKDDMIPALHKLKLCLYRRFHLTRFFQRKITFHETNNSKLSSSFSERKSVSLKKEERNLKSARLTDLKENFSTHKERILHVPSSVESKTTLECTGGKSSGDGQLTSHIVNDDGHGGVSDVARDQAAEPLLPSCVPAHFHIYKLYQTCLL